MPRQSCATPSCRTIFDSAPNAPSRDEMREQDAGEQGGAGGTAAAAAAAETARCAAGAARGSQKERQGRRRQQDAFSRQGLCARHHHANALTLFAALSAGHLGRPPGGRARAMPCVGALSAHPARARQHARLTRGKARREELRARCGDSTPPALHATLHKATRAAHSAEARNESPSAALPARLAARPHLHQRQPPPPPPPPRPPRPRTSTARARGRRPPPRPACASPPTGRGS